MRLSIILFQLVFFATYLFPQATTWSLLINTGDDRNVTSIIESQESCDIFFTGLNRQVDSYHFKGNVFKISSTGILTDSLFFENHDSSIIVRDILPDTTSKFILAVKTFGKTSQFNNCGFNLKRIDTALNIIASSKNFLFPKDYNHIEIYEQYGISNSLFIFGYIFPNQTPRMFIYELNMNFDSL